jgi:peroxiredoxin
MRIHAPRKIPILASLIVAATWAGLSLLPAAPAENAGAVSESNLLAHTLQARNADEAWTELEDANHPAPSPPAWRDTAPSNAEKEKYYLPFILALADKATNFSTRFSDDKRASQARLIAFQLLELTQQWGVTNQQPRFEAAGKSLLNDPAVTAHDHFVILWKMAQDSPPDKARPWLQEIAAGAAPDQLKSAAAGQLKKMDALGKPVDLQFTAVDGRSVDLAKLKGKVVLVDFWATWCGPCVGEVPNVKKTYDQFHSKGFEIVGISLDKEKDKLTQFTAKNKMEWPQFFDGLFWQNKYARQFGIESIPSMWLIDKKGNLRDMDAREDLAGGVAKLLAE